MKKPPLLWLPLLTAFFVFAFLLWAFAQHGTMGMFNTTGQVRLAVAILVLITITTVLTAWLGRWLKSRHRIGPSRTVTLFSLILTVPCLLGIPTAFVVLSGISQPHLGDTPPQLFITTDTGIHGLPNLAVAFNTAKATKNVLTWGEIADTGSETTIAEQMAIHTHCFLLTDLEPGTSYYYRLGDGDHYVFHTAAPTDPLRFAIGSDAHFGASTRHEDASAQMLYQIADPKNAYDYFFLVGDTVQLGFCKSHWREAFNGLSQTTESIPLYIIPGNHDTLFSGLSNYLRYASPGNQNDANKLWTRLDIWQIHFLIIDLEWSAEAFTDEQAAWLESELQSIPTDDWKIVLSHGFAYASGPDNAGRHRYDNPDTIACLAPLFEKYGVDIVFSGHNHQMEVLEKSGVTYVLSSPFGGVAENTRTYISPYSLWYQSGQHGFADMTIAGDEAVIIFRTPEGDELYRHILVRKP